MLVWILLLTLVIVYLYLSSRFVNRDVLNPKIPKLPILLFRALLSATTKREGELPPGNKFPKIRLHQKFRYTSKWAHFEAVSTKDTRVQQGLRFWREQREIR